MENNAYTIATLICRFGFKVENDELDVNVLEVITRTFSLM